MVMQLVLMVKISVRWTLLIHQAKVTFHCILGPNLANDFFCLFSSSDNADYALDYT